MSKSNIATFVIGAGLGAAATWFFAKNYFAHITEEEIESVKETYRKKYENDREDTEDVNESIEESSEESTAEEIKEYEDMTLDLGYSGKSGESAEMSEEPYIISIDEFGEADGYDAISLYHYADGVLADADDEVIDNPEEIVGSEALKHLDEDCVYVRNDRLRCDYEVVKDLRDFYKKEN